MRTAVVTAVRGRHLHLRQQLRGLARCEPIADEHVLVTMNDPAAELIAAEMGCRTTPIRCDTSRSGIPVAAARNRGAEAALRNGADLLIFLDVDCIPAVQMIGSYRRAAADPAHCDALLCGPVTYLPPAPTAGYDLAALGAMVNPHPARPTPREHQVLVSADYELFWSLSFAVTAGTWRRIGGFCTDYQGYGGEDTDFAQSAAAAGVGLRWIGGAHAFHQHHAISDPPVEHVGDIVANARLFHRRWGWWPMRGWMSAFAERGLISWTDTEVHLL